MRMNIFAKLSSATCLEVFPLHLKELRFLALSKARFKCCFSATALWTEGYQGHLPGGSAV